MDKNDTVTDTFTFFPKQAESFHFEPAHIPAEENDLGFEAWQLCLHLTNNNGGGGILMGTDLHFDDQASAREFALAMNTNVTKAPNRPGPVRIMPYLFWMAQTREGECLAIVFQDGATINTDLFIVNDETVTQGPALHELLNEKLCIRPALASGSHQTLH